MRATVSAHRSFFPLAALFAALAVPAWGARFIGFDIAAGHIDVLWHGHEMVFGFALAVIAGFLLTRVSVPVLVVLLALWMAARGVAIYGDLPWFGLLTAQIAFPVGLAITAARPFLRSAKTWRNLMFVPVLAGFVVAELVYQLGRADLIPGGGVRGLVLGADLIACLMFMMGGRLTAAASSGAVQNLGERLLHPAQTGLERNGLIALGLMMAAQVAGAPLLAGVGAGAAACVVALRLIRWKFWKVVSRPEVLCLHLGFFWLGAGLAVRAVAAALGPDLLSTVLHAVTLGALGTFSLAIMTRTYKQRMRAPIQLPRAIVIGMLLITVATVARFEAYFSDVPAQFIFVSAATWSAAYFLFLGQMAFDTRRTC
jgi:uncharacterized protein involved in response to NO